jgi:stage III sporulation protein AD
MELMAIIGLCLAATAMAVVLRGLRAEYALALSLTAGGLALAGIIIALEPVLSEIADMTMVSGIGPENTAVILKVMGVGFITQLAGESCRDAGESAIASKVELAGRVSILVLALPVFGQVLQIVSGLLRL